jgi:hypothetical protein
MCPAKIEFGRESFVLKQGAILSKQPEFSKLPPEAKKEMEEVFIIGVKGGFRVDALSGRQSGGTYFYFFSDHVEDENGYPEGVNYQLVMGTRGREKSTLVLPGRVKITPIDLRSANSRRRSHERYAHRWATDRKKLKALLRQNPNLGF